MMDCMSGMMDGMIGWMMGGMGLIGIMLVVALGLAIAALAKYLFAGR
jgi:hypothetical protein